MFAKGFNRRPITLYGDQVYLLSDVIMTPFQGEHDSAPPERILNLGMSCLRIAVKNEFGCVTKMMLFTTHVGWLFKTISHKSLSMKLTIKLFR